MCIFVFVVVALCVFVCVFQVSSSKFFKFQISCFKRERITFLNHFFAEGHIVIQVSSFKLERSAVSGALYLSD